MPIVVEPELPSMITFEVLRPVWEKHDMHDDFSLVTDTLKELKSLRESPLKVPKHGVLGEPTRIRQYSFALRQILLHRVILLFEGSLHAAIQNNPYTMILSIRGLFETTAALGFLHYRLYSLHDGNLEPADVDNSIMVQLFGSKEIEMAPDPKNVLSMLEYADKSVSKHVLEGKSGEHKMLSDCYEYLCEFSHPNFHSNALSFELDKGKNEITVDYDGDMKSRGFDILAYLLIGAPLFQNLYNLIDDLAEIESHS